jgi:hypothetical protein
VRQDLRLAAFGERHEGLLAAVAHPDQPVQQCPLEDPGVDVLRTIAADPVESGDRNGRGPAP